MTYKKLFRNVIVGFMLLGLFFLTLKSLNLTDGSPVPILVLFVGVLGIIVLFVGVLIPTLWTFSYVLSVYLSPLKSSQRPMISNAAFWKSKTDPKVTWGASNARTEMYMEYINKNFVIGYKG